MATNRKANLAQYYFFAGALSTETFEVASFSGTDGVSMPYRFSIMLLAQDDDIPYDDVANKPATLYLYRDGEFYPYSGIVSEIRYTGRNSGKASYAVTLVPRLWALGLNVQTRIFQKKKITQIIKKVLDDAGLKDYYSMKVEDSRYTEQEYVVQYQESDLNFISRLMESAGIWYHFTEQPMLEEELGDQSSKETLLITDAAANFEFVATTSDIVFKATAGMTEQNDEQDRESIGSMQVNRTVVPKEYQLKSYNYRTPEVDLTGQKSIAAGDTGTVYQYGVPAKNTSEAQRQAEVEADRIASGKLLYEGSGNCRGLRAGKRFTLQEHYRDSLNATFVITRVVHQGSHAKPTEQVKAVTYQNRFTALHADQANSYRPPLRAVVPRVPGILTAPVEANGSDYAALDDMGRYKVRMPFDVSDAANYEASKYVRLAQPYSGASYGMHFPAHEGTEMIIACVNGDPNKPLGLGTIPNANTVSPVTSVNKTDGMIRTASGHEMVMDDTAEKQKLWIKTPGGRGLLFDDENKTILIDSAGEASIILNDDKKFLQLNAGKHTVTMCDGPGLAQAMVALARGDTARALQILNDDGITIETGKGHIIQISDKEKTITIQSKAGHIIEMDDDKKKITLKDAKGKNTVQLDGSKGLILESQEKITIKATKDVEIEGANIKMSASTGKIEVKASTDMKLSGMNISAKATSDLKLEGMNVTVKADMNAKMSGGLGVDIKSDLQTKVAGLTTELSGSAMTTIKGGVVMIN